MLAYTDTSLIYERNKLTSLPERQMAKFLGKPRGILGYTAAF